MVNGFSESPHLFRRAALMGIQVFKVFVPEARQTRLLYQLMVVRLLEALLSWELVSLCVALRAQSVFLTLRLGFTLTPLSSSVLIICRRS